MKPKNLLPRPRPELETLQEKREGDKGNVVLLELLSSPNRNLKKINQIKSQILIKIHEPTVNVRQLLDRKQNVELWRENEIFLRKTWLCTGPFPHDKKLAIPAL